MGMDSQTTRPIVIPKKDKAGHDRLFSGCPRTPTPAQTRVFAGG